MGPAESVLEYAPCPEIGRRVPRRGLATAGASPRRTGHDNDSEQPLNKRPDASRRLLTVAPASSVPRAAHAQEAMQLVQSAQLSTRSVPSTPTVPTTPSQPADVPYP